MISPSISLLFANLIIGFIEFILGVRVALKLLGANVKAPFVAWTYKNSQALITPFHGIFPSLQLGPLVIDLPAITALIVYGIIGYLIIQAIERSQMRPSSQEKEKK